MELIENIFTLNRVIQIGGLVFSFLFIVLTIQIYANIVQASKTVSTKRNTGIVMISGLLVVISVVLFILGFVIL